MPVEAGSTFICKDESLTGDTEHLWVVLTDPIAHPLNVVVVNLSSCSNNRRFDPACILRPGDHWFVRHDTFVYYRGALALTAAQLTDAEISYKTALQPSVLSRIREGAGSTDRLPNNVRAQLIAQGIIAG